MNARTLIGLGVLDPLDPRIAEVYAGKYFDGGGVISALQDGNVRAVYTPGPGLAVTVLETPPGVLPSDAMLALMLQVYNQLSMHTDPATTLAYSVKYGGYLANRTPETWRTLATTFDAMVRGTMIAAKPFPWTLVGTAVGAVALAGGLFYLYRKA